MSSSTSATLGNTPDGDANASHRAYVLNVSNQVIVPPIVGERFTGISVQNHSATDWARVNIDFAPGVNGVPLAEFMLVPPRSSNSYSADRDCIVAFAVDMVDVATVPVGTAVVADQLAGLVVAGGTLVTVNLANA